MQKDTCICALAVGAPEGFTVEVEINLNGNVNSGLFVEKRSYFFTL